MSPSTETHTPSRASYQAREEALRLKELALMREEEALSRAEETNRSWINSHTHLSTFETKAHQSHTSPVIPGLQEMSPLAPGDAPSDFPHPGPPPRPWAAAQRSAAGPIRATASPPEASNRQGATFPLTRPPRLPPMEIDVSRQTSLTSSAHSACLPNSQLSLTTSNLTHHAHDDGAQQRPESEDNPPSPHLSATGPALATDGSLLLMPPKEHPKMHTADYSKTGDGSKDHHGREHHPLWNLKGGMGSSARLLKFNKGDGGERDKAVTGASKQEKEESASDDEKDKHKGDKDGKSSDDDEDDGYGSHDGDDREARSPGERGGKKKRYYPKMRKAVTVSRTVKVHKLNEMGEIVDKKGHNAWEMACGLQLGIRVMVSVNCQVTHAAVPDFDTFQQHVKLKFPAGGGPTTPPHDGPSFKFKDYAPIIFSNLREMFSIDTADYLVALCNTRDDGTNALRIMGTPGKSGSLFFFSHDMRFIVKTLPKREAILLREILPAYYQHVRQNPGTYLPRFYGLYRWKHEYTRKNVRFVVMNNVFATSLAIHKRFDLKGSTLGRTASTSERKKGPRTIFKDLDMKETGFKMKLGAARKKSLLDQIRSDCHLLMSLKIMDYSLLLGVHDRRMDGTNQDSNQPGWTVGVSMDNLQSTLDKGGDYNPSGIEGMLPDGQPAGERYFLGVIDILMLYTRRKKMERVWKTMTGGEGAAKGGVSSQPPPKYAIRFCNFLE
eukprot:CAMPEP_0169445084 /NCGR_PEP_ID=MMETSP1042-20121227/10255_1 /TAXON_ID=464988 /ORGANISM="Hemiselmis andersenii, Strain CCMP1180" /LENGTH=722 /DNA_ID=CAMNT_0009556465 /DNA_START=151 /DNA_END=2316 /DNA_ORIENTATION=-